MRYNNQWLANKVSEVGNTKKFSELTGVTRWYVSQMVAGERVPTPTLVTRIAKGLDLSSKEVESKLGLNYPNPWLRDLISDKGFTIEALSEKMGMRSNNVSAIIAGKRPIGVKVKARFAKALGVSLEELEGVLDERA